MTEYYPFSDFGKVNGPGCDTKEEFYVNEESTIEESFAVPNPIPGMKKPLIEKPEMVELPESPVEEPAEAPVEAPEEPVEAPEEPVEAPEEPVVSPPSNVSSESSTVTNVNIVSSGYRTVPSLFYTPIAWFGTLVGVKDSGRPQFKFSALIFLVLFAILITMLARRN